MGFWRDIENAVQEAIARASGLDSNHVVWAYDDAGAPELPFIDLNLANITTLGIDYLKTSVDLTRANGQEIKQEVRGVREVVLELQAFTKATSDDGSARALLENTKTALLLDSVRGILTGAGVSPFGPGSVDYVPAVVAVGFRGRATCPIRCYMPAPAVAEYTGYIAKVSGTVTVHGGRTDPLVTPFVAPK